MLNAPHASAAGAAAACRDPCARAGQNTGEVLDISREDWNILYAAVIAQLRRIVEVRFERDSGLQVLDAGSVRTRVLACVAALEKLQAARPR